MVFCFDSIDCYKHLNSHSRFLTDDMRKLKDSVEFFEKQNWASLKINSLAFSSHHSFNTEHEKTFVFGSKEWVLHTMTILFVCLPLLKYLIPKHQLFSWCNWIISFPGIFFQIINNENSIILCLRDEFRYHVLLMIEKKNNRKSDKEEFCFKDFTDGRGKATASSGNFCTNFEDFKPLLLAEISHFRPGNPIARYQLCIQGEMFSFAMENSVSFYLETEWKWCDFHRFIISWVWAQV